MPRRFATAFAALAGLGFGLLGSEMTFGQLRPARGSSGAVLYSIELRNASGDLLASPMLVGEEGRPVHLNMLSEEESDPLRMSLDLDPRSEGGDNICLGYRLSIDDGSPHSGRIGVSYGKERSVRLGRSLRLSLVVARAHSKDFDRLLQRLRRPSA
jgi:hypothetical protein